MKIIAILASVINATMNRYSLLVTLMVISASASVAQHITIIPKAGLALSSVRNHPGIFDSPARSFYFTPIATATGYSYVGSWRWANGETSTPLYPPLGPPPEEENFTEIEDQHIRLKAGFTVGAAVNITFSDYFSLQPEINFVQKGASIHYSNYDELQVPGQVGSPPPSIAMRLWGEGKMTVYYLEMPVLAKYTFRAQPSWAKFFVVAGPSVSVGLGGKMSAEENFGAISGTGTGTLIGFINVSESHSKRDGKIVYGDGMFASKREDLMINRRVTFGAQVGGGALLFDKISVDIRYGTDFTSLYDRYSNAYNQTFQATVGFPLALN